MKLSKAQIFCVKTVQAWDSSSAKMKEKAKKEYKSFISYTFVLRWKSE